MVSSILPKNERWDNFQYKKLSQRSFFGRIEDTIICFRYCLTFSHISLSSGMREGQIELKTHFVAATYQYNVHYWQQ